jgi:hypothetical protein
VAAPAFKYKPPGPVAAAFMKSGAFVRAIRGPVGSGKSTACCAEIMRRACEQKPNKQGIRRSRWAIVRNTNPELKTTTIKTWLDLFPEDVWGDFCWSVPYNHHLDFPLPDGSTVELEVLFLALDRPEDVKKLLSLELTGVFGNEARELPKAVIDGMTMRVGRFPSMREGGPSWYGVILDTNSPDEDHWWPILAGESPIPEYITLEERLMLQKPDNWEFFSQPPAMLEEMDPGTKLVTGYSINEGAENLKNLVARLLPEHARRQNPGLDLGLCAQPPRLDQRRQAGSRHLPRGDARRASAARPDRGPAGARRARFRADAGRHPRPAFTARTVARAV